MSTQFAKLKNFMIVRQRRWYCRQPDRYDEKRGA